MQLPHTSGRVVLDLTNQTGSCNGKKMVSYYYYTKSCLKRLLSQWSFQYRTAVVEPAAFTETESNLLGHCFACNCITVFSFSIISPTFSLSRRRDHGSHTGGPHLLRQLPYWVEGFKGPSTATPIAFTNFQWWAKCFCVVCGRSGVSAGLYAQRVWLFILI